MSRARTGVNSAVATAVGLAISLGFVTTGPAYAETSEQARQKARAAAEVVERLQPRVDAALAAYQASLRGLAQDVSTGIQADQGVSAARRTQQDLVRTADQRVRAFYMAGGQPGILASVLDAGSPTEMMMRLGNIRRVFDADQEASTRAEAVLVTAQGVAAAASATADQTVATVGDTEQRLRTLTGLLDQAQAALDALDARARQLEDVERAAAALAAARAAADTARWTAADTATARGIPVTFLALYRQAARTCPGLPWPVLAAIGQVETGHGSNPNDSPAGAQGPMQFLPSTFGAYAVDGDHDGRADIRNPADAIYTAGAYLCANGAGRSDNALRGAIWRYNHANWYVAMVLRIAGQIADRFHEPPVPPYEPVG